MDQKRMKERMRKRNASQQLKRSSLFISFSLKVKNKLLKVMDKWSERPAFATTCGCSTNAKQTELNIDSSTA